MPDYTQGKIYIIRSPHTPNVYIGSTILTLDNRMKQHIRLASLYPRDCISSRQIINAGDAYIELFENYPCETKGQLLKREGEFIRGTPHCINARKNVGVPYVYFKKQTKDTMRIERYKCAVNAVLDSKGEFAIAVDEMLAHVKRGGDIREEVNITIALNAARERYDNAIGALDEAEIGVPWDVIKAGESHMKLKDAHRP